MIHRWLYTLCQIISLIDNISEKTVFLCTTIKFMGLELDYIKFEIKLSEDKLLRLQKFNNVLKRKLPCVSYVPLFIC